jgi:hypothetical protein
MSDASIPHCEKCNQPEYACRCEASLCADCGEELDEEAMQLGRELCFSCYCPRLNQRVAGDHRRRAFLYPVNHKGLSQ